MRSRTVALALAAVLSVGLVALTAHSARASRMEAELFWDDGSAEGGFALTDGTMVAVGFYAPETALTVTGMRVYFRDDGIPHTPDPEWPSTAPFNVWVFTTGLEGQPAFAASIYVPVPWRPCPEDSWADIVFPEPIDISDEAYFPDHKFHIGLESEIRDGPIVGLDLDPPFSGETRYWDWSTWVLVDTADAMIRAVVCDTSAVPVELESWGRVKSEYR